LQDGELGFTGKHGERRRGIGDEREGEGAMAGNEVQVDGDEGDIGEPRGPEFPV
jgi:hypothetical protein